MIKIKISSHHHHHNQNSHALNHLTKPTKDQNQAKLSQLSQPAQLNDQNHQHMMERSKDRPAHCTIFKLKTTHEIGLIGTTLHVYEMPLTLFAVGNDTHTELPFQCL